MTNTSVRDAYADRAAEYTTLLGSMSATSEHDRQLVREWALGLSASGTEHSPGLRGPAHSRGPDHRHSPPPTTAAALASDSAPNHVRVIDAGCGPGHWTAFLAELGVAAEGIDQVQTFIAQARTRFPGVPFRGGSLGALPVPDGYAAGILAWYSTIHFAPTEIPAVLDDLARCIAPGGSLLLGFFEGAAIEPFPHAVTTAYHWPVAELSQRLEAAGFRVESTNTRTDPGQRPHAAIVASRKRTSLKKSS